MRKLYSFLLWLLLPLALLWFAWKPELRASLPQRLGRYPTARPVTYWLHAASVGEVLAARPLIEAMLQRFPEREILVTTFTASGARFVQTSFGERVQHAYLPLDLSPCIESFLQSFAPRCAIFLETELWPNIMATLQRRAVPLLIANGRLSPTALAHYRRLAPLFRPLLAAADFVAAQSATDGARYLSLGVTAERLCVVGNLKYDLTLPDNTVTVGNALRRQWGVRPVLLAASTRDGEEAQLLELLPRLRQRWPALLLVLVPRHPQRFEAVAQLVQRAGFSLRRRSEGCSDKVVEQVYLGDTLGELTGFYQAADVIFVGGSLVPLGGHNPLEAAALGKSVIVGPHTFNFDEVYQRLAQQQAVRRADGLPALAALIEHQLANPQECVQMGERALQVMEENRGGVAATLAIIERYSPAD